MLDRRTGRPRVSAAALRSPPLRRKLFPGDVTSVRTFRKGTARFNAGPSGLAGTHWAVARPAPTDTSRFIQYRLRARYDIDHSEVFKICHATRHDAMARPLNCVNGNLRPARAHPLRRLSAGDAALMVRGHTTGPSPAYRRPTGGLLSGSPDDVADPGTGLLIQGTGHLAGPRRTVGLDLLQNHPAQPGEHCNAHDSQHHGFRFLSHAHILLTRGSPDHSAQQPRPRHFSSSRACP